MSKIIFNAKYLRMLAPFMGRGDPRWYLNGIAVFPRAGGGAVLASTNGHGMVLIIDEHAKCDKHVVVKVDYATITASKRRTTKGSAMLCSIDADKNRLMLVESIFQDTSYVESDVEHFLQPNNCLIEGDKYPGYKRLLPDFTKLESGLGCALSNNLIEKLAQIQSSKRTMCGIRLWNSPGRSSNEIYVQLLDHPNVLVILMLMRDDYSRSHSDVVRLASDLAAA